MASLKERLGAAPKRQEVVTDALRVLDAEVEDKGGLGGMAIRSAYKLVKGIKPGFIREVVEHLLDDFLDALDPIFQEAVARGVAPGGHLRQNAGKMADGLLAVTDAKASRARMPAIKKTYSALRPTAKKHVEAAAPRLGEMLDRHAS